MSQRQAVLLVVAVAVVAVGLPVAGAQETATETPIATNDTDESGLGTQLTAFLQSNSAAANDTVENGMWKAGFDRANESAKADLVTRRTGSLEQRLEQLKTENRTLRKEYENGTISEQAYVARQSRLSARIDSLQTAVNDTETAAENAGVNDSRLTRLKQNASELSGPAVAGIARGLGGGPGAAPGQATNGTDADRPRAPGQAADGTTAGQAPNATDGQGPPNDDPDRNETGANGGDGAADSSGDGGDGGGPPAGGSDGSAETQGDGGDGGSGDRGDGGDGGSSDGGDGESDPSGDRGADD
jgi:hypothetical protein